MLPKHEGRSVLWETSSGLTYTILKYVMGRLFDWLTEELNWKNNKELLAHDK